MNVRIENAVSPYEEMVAYETLWSKKGVDLKEISSMFENSDLLPSTLYEREKSRDIFSYQDIEAKVRNHLKSINGFSVSVNGTFQYPKQLRVSAHPIELFYYKGDIGLLESRMISVVGARNCSERGRINARRISKALVEHNITVVSGLAVGIDTEAMTTAIKEKGRTIGVIGTPVNQCYPKENCDLQYEVAKNHLLISHVPFYRYSIEPFQFKRRYFPQRNVIMATLSEGTVIIEASDTSGSLTQAKACIEQGKKLYILNSCLQNKEITWPQKFLEKGAILIENITDFINDIG
ncbi:DNA-processing protein DprA [Chloroflexota bacterium]